MRKSKNFASMPVISLEEGRQIGLVRGLVIDPEEKKIAALVIEQKGWKKDQRFIPFHKIRSAGNDAVTIEKTSGVDKAASLPDIARLLKEKVLLTGSRIIAEDGTALGNVDEYYIDPSTGRITSLEFSGNKMDSVIKGRASLDIAHVRTLGQEVVVVTNEALDSIIKVDGGLQETVKNLKDSTSQIWENTRQRTKELGSSINKSLEKVKKDKKSDSGDSEDTQGPKG